MRFRWRVYTSEDESLVERWMDEEAKRFTGCEDGWAEFYRYWANEPDIVPDRNFWVILACENELPCAVFAIFEKDRMFTFSECLVDPQKRGCGIGSAALRECLQYAYEIIGMRIGEAMAVIFPENTASQRMFMRAGFRYVDTHSDGDALYYLYTEPQYCFCGHDCAKCITRLSSRLKLESLQKRAVTFYRDAFQMELYPEEVQCSGARNGDVCRVCRDCPFMQCCKEKGFISCVHCPNPCEQYITYKEKYVNQCHQI